MNPTVTIHSDADGVTRTTLTKTGADTGRFPRLSGCVFSRLSDWFLGGITPTI